MSTKAIIGVIIGVAIIAIGILAVYNFGLDDDKNLDKQEEQEEEVWNTAGAFGINKHVYKLGEDIFFAGNLLPDQQVLVRMANPEGEIILERFYSGADREQAKFYFKPDTSASKGIYTKDQLIGKWTMWFEGINNDVIYFEIIDEFVPGTEDDIVDLRRADDTTRENNNPDLITVERPP